MELSTVTFRVINTRAIDLGTRSIILNRVVPPQLPPAPALPATAPTADLADVGATEEIIAEKKHEVLFVSATVYDRQVTEVRWFASGREMRIHSNIDFNLLAGAGSFETADTVYSLIVGLDNQTREEAEALNQQAAAEGLPEHAFKQIPPVEAFSKTRSEYTIAASEAGAAPPEEILEALDALHAFYDANRQRLADDYDKREAARTEQERWLK